MSGYVEFRVAVAAPHWPALEALLDELGAVAVTQSGGDRALFDEPGVLEDSAWSAFVVEALFEPVCDRAAIAAALRELLGTDVMLTERLITDQAWAETWKQHWQPMRFAGGLCVCPSWLEPPAAARHVIRLDPGQAFGTGTHESTALCLDWLGGLAPLTARTVIDYGTGSGVLALAASLLGARRVLAVDIDRDAQIAAAENVLRNDCAAVVRVGAPDLVDGVVVDILVANILAAPLVGLAARFAALVRPGGRLALAGLLETQAEAVAAAYTAAFDLTVAAARGEWILLAGTRRGGDAPC